MANSSIATADEILIALLDRVVQEMLDLGIHLRAATEEGIVRRDVQAIVTRLASVVEDIRETVMTWQFGENWAESGRSEGSLAVTRSSSEVATAPADYQDVPERAVPHLRRASEMLEHPAAAVTPDGGRWIALNHAVHHLHASIAALQNTLPDGAA
ncbi:MAG TPA: hypothetical protein VNG12_17255 [Acidimicrobiales bacterium]|nr:hypothetical protein [Acidimicrobiales bacterium]